LLRNQTIELVIYS